MIEFGPFEIFVVIIAEIVKELILGFKFNLDFDAFNPIRNYNKWIKMNWFAVILGTLILYIIYPIFVILYLGYKLLTIGRKPNI